MPGKIDIFLVQIAAITERISIRREKAAVRADDEETRRCLHAIINCLTFQLVTETLETNLARVSLHQLVIMQRLPVANVSPVLILLLYFATGVDVDRIFPELKNIRSEKADPVFDRTLQRANRCHHRND